MRSAAELSEHRIRPPIPLRDFFRNPERTAYQISPSGGSIAFLGPYENRLNIWVQSARGGEARRITSFTERDITAYLWKSDQHIPFFQDSGADENSHLFSALPDNDNVLDLPPLPGRQARLLHALPHHPNYLI